MKQKSKSSKSLHIDDKSKKPSKWSFFLNLFSNKKNKKEEMSEIKPSKFLFNNPVYFDKKIENSPPLKPSKEKSNDDLPSPFIFSQRKTINDPNDTLCNLLKRSMKSPEKKFMSDVLFTNSNLDENSVRKFLAIPH